MQGTFLFLGTGASAGVPIIGCSCTVCCSLDPRNQRLRPSGLIQIERLSLLLDIGPDFRTQALKYKVPHLDGLLLTHTHYDHIAGIDELRAINFRQKKAFPCLLSQESFEDLQRRYYYLFQKTKSDASETAKLDWHVLAKDAGEIDFLGVKVRYMTYFQGGMKVTGYRMGSFAYVSDIRTYEPSIFSHLSGVKQLVISALRQEPSPVHFSLEEAAAFADQVGAEETYLTHLSHAVDAENTSLPSGVQLGIDGMKISFEVF